MTRLTLASLAFWPAAEVCCGLLLIHAVRAKAAAIDTEAALTKERWPEFCCDKMHSPMERVMRLLQEGPVGKRSQEGHSIPAMNDVLNVLQIV
jgi:hypothetical protein